MKKILIIALIMFFGCSRLPWKDEPVEEEMFEQEEVEVEQLYGLHSMQGAEIKAQNNNIEGDGNLDGDVNVLDIVYCINIILGSDLSRTSVNLRKINLFYNASFMHALINFLYSFISYSNYI